MRAPLPELSVPPYCRSLRAVVAAVLDDDGRIIDHNAGFARLLELHGLSPQEPVVTLFLAPSWREIVSAGHEGVLTLGSQRGGHSLLGAIRREAGYLSMLAEYDVAGLERTTALVLDVNERLADTQRELAREQANLRRATRELAARRDQLEERVAERTAELRQALDRLMLASAAFQHAQESIVITDTEDIIVAVNPAFTQVTGYAEEEALGRHIRMLKSDAHDRSFYLQMWETIHRTGAWRGEVRNRRRDGEVYRQWLGISTVRDANGAAAYYIGVASDLSRMNRAMSELEYLAHHDTLTGLPNRLQLATRLDHSLERSLRDGRRCAVLYIDLDRFKPVNDRHGHAAGDELLCQVARRLQSRLRHVDTVARIGGDEFVIVLEGVKTEAQVFAFTQSLVERIATPYRLGSRQGVDVEIGASVGIALFPDDADNASALLEAADRALYEVKRGGGKGFQRAGR